MLFSSIDQFMHSIVSYTENLQNFSFITSGSIKMYQNFLIGRINLPQTYPKKKKINENFELSNRQRQKPIQTQPDLFSLHSL